VYDGNDVRSAGQKGVQGQMRFKKGLIGIVSDDKEIGEKDNPLLPGIVRSTQAHIFREIKSAAKNNLIKLDEKKKGRMVLGFVIDYDDLVKSIKDDSLSQYGKTVGKKTKKDKYQKQ